MSVAPTPLEQMTKPEIINASVDAFVEERLTKSIYACGTKVALDERLADHKFKVDANSLPAAAKARLRLVVDTRKAMFA